jgi:hypothetical protein
MTEPYLATLNPEQLHAVEHSGDQPLLIARRGALLPFGGYKGFGLALMIQALGLLAGSGSEQESDYGYLSIAYGPRHAWTLEVTERWNCPSQWFGIAPRGL